MGNEGGRGLQRDDAKFDCVEKLRKIHLRFCHILGKRIIDFSLVVHHERSTA